MNYLFKPTWVTGLLPIDNPVILEQLKKMEFVKGQNITVHDGNAVIKLEVTEVNENEVIFIGR